MSKKSQRIKVHRQPITMTSQADRISFLQSIPTQMERAKRTKSALIFLTLVIVCLLFALISRLIYDVIPCTDAADITISNSPQATAFMDDDVLYLEFYEHGTTSYLDGYALDLSPGGVIRIQQTSNDSNYYLTITNFAKKYKTAQNDFNRNNPATTDSDNIIIVRISPIDSLPHTASHGLAQTFQDGIFGLSYTGASPVNIAILVAALVSGPFLFTFALALIAEINRQFDKNLAELTMQVILPSQD